jgi:hypothetical protein
VKRDRLGLSVDLLLDLDHHCVKIVLAESLDLESVRVDPDALARLLVGFGSLLDLDLHIRRLVLLDLVDALGARVDDELELLDLLELGVNLGLLLLHKALEPALLHLVDLTQEGLVVIDGRLAIGL